MFLINSAQMWNKIVSDVYIKKRKWNPMKMKFVLCHGLQNLVVLTNVTHLIIIIIGIFEFIRAWSHFNEQ